MHRLRLHVADYLDCTVNRNLRTICAFDSYSVIHDELRQASLAYQVPSCTNGFVTLLVLRLACLSNVKVVCWDVLERHNLQVSVSEYKLVI